VSRELMVIIALTHIPRSIWTLHK